jgi:hypothetical protein
MRSKTRIKRDNYLKLKIKLIFQTRIPPIHTLFFGDIDPEDYTKRIHEMYENGIEPEFLQSK